MDKIALLVDIQALKSENAALRECLAWYADPDEPIENDQGQRASDVLGKVEKQPAVVIPAGEFGNFMTEFKQRAEKLYAANYAIHGYASGYLSGKWDAISLAEEIIAQKYAPRAEGKEGE